MRGLWWMWRTTANALTSCTNLYYVVLMDMQMPVMEGDRHPATAAGPTPANLPVNRHDRQRHDAEAACFAAGRMTTLPNPSSLLRVERLSPLDNPAVRATPAHGRCASPAARGACTGPKLCRPQPLRRYLLCHSLPIHQRQRLRRTRSNHQHQNTPSGHLPPPKPIPFCLRPSGAPHNPHASAGSPSCVICYRRTIRQRPSFCNTMQQFWKLPWGMGSPLSRPRFATFDFEQALEHLPEGQGGVQSPGPDSGQAL